MHRRNTEVFVRALTNLSVIDDSGDHPDLLKGDKIPTSLVSKYNQEMKGGRNIVARPVLKGTNVLPNENKTDCMARLQFKDLKRTILDGAAESWSSELHGIHPVPGMAFGAEFGLGTPTQGWKY